MMRVYENGVFRDATPEEIEDIERMMAEAEAERTSELSDHDRIVALEEQLAAAKILLGVSE